jgi:hypothetical protein
MVRAMTLRDSLLLGTALAILAGAADAQQRRSREDLLDALTRHIQICAELGDGPARLACYDKLQTQVGDVQAAPSPTPLARSPQPAGPAAGLPPVGLPSAAPAPETPTTGGNQIGAVPLAPPPLMVPGGGAATLGSAASPPAPTLLAPPAAADPDRAFNPRDTMAYRPPDAPMPRPQPSLRRSGPRTVPTYSGPMPVMSLQASNLTYGDSRFWQVTLSVTSNVNRAIDAQIQCTFLNAGRSVGEAYLGPITLSPGEQVSTELIGPPTSAFVDSTNCRVMNP